MNKIIKSFIFFYCTILLVACGSESITNINDEAKETGDISFLILDRSGKALDSVKIVRISDNKSKLTDESGNAVWKKNNIGTHVFTVTKEGYAPMRISVSVNELGLGNVARVPDTTKTVVMNKLGATIQGTMMYRDYLTGNLVAAAEIPVILTFAKNTFITSEIIVNTDENGKYIFDNLPENVSVSITVPQTTIEKYLYSLSSPLTVNIDRVNEVKNIEIMELTLIAKKNSLIKTNLTEIDTNTNLSLSFSTALDEDSISNYWQVKNSLSTRILISASLKDSNTIIIKPVSGTWEKGETYFVTGSAFTIDGSKTTISESFTVGKVTSSIPDQVDNLKVTSDGTTIDLSWDAPSENVNGYYIYYKTNSMSDYILLYTTSSTSYSTTEYSLKEKTTDTSVNFIVLPYNDAGTADISKAKIVKHTFEE